MSEDTTIYSRFGEEVTIVGAKWVDIENPPPNASDAKAAHIQIKYDDGDTDWSHLGNLRCSDWGIIEASVLAVAPDFWD